MCAIATSIASSRTTAETNGTRPSISTYLRAGASHWMRKIESAVPRRSWNASESRCAFLNMRARNASVIRSDSCVLAT